MPLSPSSLFQDSSPNFPKSVTKKRLFQLAAQQFLGQHFLDHQGGLFVREIGEAYQAAWFVTPKRGMFRVMLEHHYSCMPSFRTYQKVAIEDWCSDLEFGTLDCWLQTVLSSVSDQPDLIDLGLISPDEVAVIALKTIEALDAVHKKWKNPKRILDLFTNKKLEKICFVLPDENVDDYIAKGNLLRKNMNSVLSQILGEWEPHPTLFAYGLACIAEEIGDHDRVRTIAKIDMPCLRSLDLSRQISAWDLLVERNS